MASEHANDDITETRDANDSTESPNDNETLLKVFSILLKNQCFDEKDICRLEATSAFAKWIEQNDVWKEMVRDGRRNSEKFNVLRTCSERLSQLQANRTS